MRYYLINGFCIEAEHRKEGFPLYRFFGKGVTLGTFRNVMTLVDKSKDPKVLATMDWMIKGDRNTTQTLPTGTWEEKRTLLGNVYSELNKR